MVLGALINHPERLNRDTLYELRAIVARYPYFQTARLLLLNNLYLLHEPDFGTELRRSVLYVADRRALCRLIEGYTDRVVPDTETVMAEEPGVDRTLSLIDAFLGTLPEEQGSGLPLAADVVGDYATRFLVGDDSEKSADGSLELIDRFLAENDSQSESASDSSVSGGQTSQPTLSEGLSSIEEVMDENSLDESYFTETLAKIYIKQHKYSRALEIIRSLYLKYPEKNVYFADQIRFLEKLIINNNSK